MIPAPLTTNMRYGRLNLRARRRRNECDVNNTLAWDICLRATYGQEFLVSISEVMRPVLYVTVYGPGNIRYAFYGIKMCAKLFFHRASDFRSARMVRGEQHRIVITGGGVSAVGYLMQIRPGSDPHKSSSSLEADVHLHNFAWLSTQLIWLLISICPCTSKFHQIRLFGIIDAPRHVSIWQHALQKTNRSHLWIPVIAYNVEIIRPQFALAGLTLYYFASMATVKLAVTRLLVTIMHSIWVPYPCVRFSRWKVIEFIFRIFESTVIVADRQRPCTRRHFSWTLYSVQQWSSLTSVDLSYDIYFA